MVTVASLVEFEGVPDIYPEVAGAIYNRIDRPDDETNGLIQSDASVTYGLGKRSYHVSDEEKRDKSNPYNTFAHPGLPVGPIGSPGDESIKAAANPDENDYYYWVTVNLDSGETKFAENFEEHNRNVQEYQEWCSDNEGRCN
ncbi:endolytic transglycosylase MltG [Kocuria atrinae]|uniref:endolytic transglycosylase MltG n=1 Tax=Kocuria atrinae TaxID=592377 RepID=UPI0021D3FB7C|nr:endolytic transglycosylase MltG [Kocuria atrinae]